MEREGGWVRLDERLRGCVHLLAAAREDCLALFMLDSM